MRQSKCIAAQHSGNKSNDLRSTGVWYVRRRGEHHAADKTNQNFAGREIGMGRLLALAASSRGLTAVVHYH